MAVGKFDGPEFLFVFLQFVSLALLARRTGLSFDLVGQCIRLSPFVSEDILHRENLRAEIGDLFLKFIPLRPGRRVNLLVGLL